MAVYKTSEILQDDNLDSLITKIKQLEGVVDSLTTALKKQEGEAVSLEAATKDLNVATAEGREQILKNAKAANELEKSYSSMAEELLDAEKATQELRQAKKLLSDIAKNQVRANTAEEGSYNQLAAQYNIVKITLNAMSKAQRENTKEGRDMVKQANAIYQEMKRLQAETGKTALNVGNYSEAVEGAVQNLGEMRQELRALRDLSFSGKTQTEIDAINKRIGELRDNMQDLQAIQDAYGMETGALVAGSLQFFASSLEGIVATTKLLGIQSPILDKLQNSVVELIAVTHALGEIEDILQKRTLQAAAARIKETALTIKDTVVKWANTVATTAAARAEDAKTIAITRGNILTRAAAAAQWLWNAALAANPIGLVIAGVVALTAGIVILVNSMGDATEQAEELNAELNKLAGQRASLEEWQKFQSKLWQEMGIEGSKLTERQKVQTKERIAQVEQEIAILDKLLTINKLTDEQSKQRTDLARELIELKDEQILQGVRETRQLKEEADARAKAAEAAAKKAKAERERLAKEAAAQLKEKQDALLNELKAQKDYDLARLDADRDYSNKSISYQNEFSKIRFATEQAANTQIIEKQKEFGRITETEYKAQLERIKADTAKFISELPTVVDEVGNSLKRNIEAAFGSGQGNVNPLQNIFSVNAENDIKARAERIAKSAGDGLSSGLKQSAFERLMDGESIYDLLRITDEDQQAMKSAFDFAKGQLASYMDALQKASDRRVQMADRNVAAAENELNRQTQLLAAGEANTYDTAQRQLERSKADQEKALEQQRKTQRAAQAINTIEQTSSLITATANLWKSFSGTGPVSPALALGAIGLMWGSFAFAKIRAAQLAKQEYGEGDFQILQGGSHASGNDIPLGTFSAQGLPEYAEGGEARMILSKRSTAKYRSILPHIYAALKAGTFESEFTRQSDFAHSLPMLVTMNNGGYQVSMKGVESGLGRLIEQGNTRNYTDSRGRRVERRGSIETVYIN